MQIIDLTDTVKTDVKETTSLPTELENLLSEYKEAPKNETSNNPILSDMQGGVVPNNGSPNNSISSSTVYPPGTEFYKTGKKAGQPKPNRKVKTSFTPSPLPTTLNGSILTGALFITLLDLLMPVLIAGLNNRYSKQKIKASDLSMNARQRNELAPVADAFLKQANLEANPTITLLVGVIGIYAGNYVAVKMTTNLNQKDNEKNNTETSKN